MQENNDKKSKLKASLIILSFILVIAIGIGLAYAYFNAQSNTTAKTITTGSMQIVYEDGTDIVNTGKLFPIEEADILTKANDIPFKVINKGDSDVNISIGLTEITSAPELKSSDLKWALYEGNASIANGSFDSVGTDLIMINSISIPAKTNNTKSYTLRIWLQETGDDQSNLMDKSLTARIVVNGNKSINEKKLSEQILGKDKSNVISKAPTFDTASTDKGLFMNNDKTDNGLPTYYYRGNVQNNYVGFANRLWRIVRINEDDTIKLILQNEIAIGCKENVDSLINNWYNDKIFPNYSRYLETFKSVYSATDLNSDLKLSNQFILNNFSFNNGDTNKYVGLISTAESFYSGILVDSTIASGSYMTINKNFWIADNIGYPAIDYFSFLYVYDAIYNRDHSVNVDSPVIRPAINLKKDIKVLKGNGTIGNPYILTLDDINYDFSAGGYKDEYNMSQILCASYKLSGGGN